RQLLWKRISAAAGSGVGGWSARGLADSLFDVVDVVGELTGELLSIGALMREVCFEIAWIDEDTEVFDVLIGRVLVQDSADEQVAELFSEVAGFPVPGHGARVISLRDGVGDVAGE